MKMHRTRIARIRQLDNLKIQTYTASVRPMVLDMFDALLRDFVNTNPRYGSADAQKDLATIQRRLDHEGLGFLALTLPALMNDLFIFIEGGKPLYLSWRKPSGREYPAFLGRLFAEVHQRGNEHDMAFGQIYQVCSLFKKLKGPFRQSSLRNDLRKFVEVDEEIGRLNFTSEITKPILDKARSLIDKLFNSVSLDDIMSRLRPRPGPGATNTPVDKPWRFRPHVVYEQLEEDFYYPEWFHSFHSWDPVEDWRRYINLPQKGDAESRFKFVPKYLFKPRGICIEENEMQFFQQAVKGYLYDYLESHPTVRGKINFTKQKINQDLALLSSVTGEYATIDMSSASDRISRELVHRLFHNTNLFTLLDTLSTRRISLGKNKIMYAHKFAPMGSGVCFPVMSLVHWALVRSIVMLTTHPDSYRDADEVYVYGDDIIIPTKYCEAVYTYLPYFGMRLNMTKSFRHGPFRESCGVHAINGKDITPIYINHVIEQTHLNSDSTTLLSLIAKEDLANRKGLTALSQCIMRHVHKTYGALPFVGKASSILGFKRDGSSDMRHVSTYARRRRYNADTQQWEYLVRMVRPRFDDSTFVPPCDGYLRWLLTHTRENAQEFEGSVEDLKICRQWAAIYN